MSFADPLKMFPKRWSKKRREIIKRDGHRCMFVENGKRCRHKRMLQVHHIIPKSENPALLWDDNNLITLCVKHHKMISGREHEYMGKFRKLLDEAEGSK